jgi:succinate dehydrogenase / fumarate reductase cytochrome b subunit
MSKRAIGIWTTVAKKILMALTGLSLVIFVCAHLVGNLLLYVGPAAFNAYAHKLMSLGGLLYVAEAILTAFFLVHIVTAIWITLGNWRARPDSYEVRAAQGHPSRMNISSKTMIWTGLILAVFTVIHLINFKYGPGIEEGYTFILDGETARDLYRLVAESFAREVYVIPYVLCMVLLGYHIRHGFWSAFQSLGVNHPRYTPVIYGIGVLAAIVLGVGFIAIPIWFYVGGAA